MNHSVRICFDGHTCEYDIVNHRFTVDKIELADLLQAYHFHRSITSMPEYDTSIFGKLLDEEERRMYQQLGYPYFDQSICSTVYLVDDASKIKNIVGWKNVWFRYITMDHQQVYAFSREMDTVRCIGQLRPEHKHSNIQKLLHRDVR